jgi:tRNA-specific 2-thiouridylase
VKWDDLLKRADELGCKYIATGHYAQVMQEQGRWFLRRGTDPEKDQTYVLWGLTQEQLSRTLFPLGGMHKEQVREIAREHGLEHIAGKSESYEICFIPDNDYRGFLRHRVPDLEARVNGGEFRTLDGQVLGKHQGYPFYTIGQRKGLVVAVGHPLYVNRIDPEKNIVYLGTREELEQHSLKAGQLNLMKYDDIAGQPDLRVMIRYHDRGTPATVAHCAEGLEVRFHQAVYGVTPGQSAVFYEGDDLLGGGFIL